MISEELIKKVSEKAEKNRKKLIDVLHKTGGGHFGGSLSVNEILTTLYEGIMNVDPADPKKEDRDYFVLCKGHALAMQAVVLAEAGFVEDEELYTFNELASIFGMHPNIHVPTVDIPTGSLGLGLSNALGLAAALKLDGKPNRVFAVLGDGEMHEGQNYEALMAAPKWELDNLIAIVDRNKLSMDGPTETFTVPLEPLEDKIKAFNWSVKRVNGNDVEELMKVLDSVPFVHGKPSFIIADTVKGKGVDFMEGDFGYHYAKIDDEKYDKAMDQQK